MRFVILAILIGFPTLEGALLWHFAAGPHGHAAWVLAWLAFSAIAGIVLIKQARFSLVSRLAQALSQGTFSIAALVDSFRTVIAGLLLIFPGFISDLMALLILLIPIREPALVRSSHGTASMSGGARGFRRDASEGNVIEGDFRRE
ncbi:MAG: FxsA family protein [Burkholderiales bacterium]|jgi:UPF0716 protein FxsA|nr:FxsA family protein [Nitrosomonadaceae bacterium]